MKADSWNGYFETTLSGLKKSGCYRSMRVIEENAGPWVTIKGRKLLNFSSNDYLGLSQHSRVCTAVKHEISRFGHGVGASRLVTGNNAVLDKLEREAARFKKTEAVLVFSSGYMANVGIISALAEKNDRIISDRLNHASIIDGCRLSGAGVEIYPHGDTSALEKLLSRPHRRGRTLVVTDAVFSMDGDLAPLNEIVPLCREYEAQLMIDDAHGTGVLGDRGSGTLEHFGLDCPEVIQVGTFSKALGGLGGFVAARSPVIDFMINKVRTQIYSTGLPSPVAQGNREALRLVVEDSGARKRLAALGHRLQKEITKLDFPAPRSETCIVPLIIGSTEKTVIYSRELMKAGILAPAIRPPTVPPDTCRIRLSVTALHEEGHIDRLIDTIQSIKAKIG